MSWMVDFPFGGRGRFGSDYWGGPTRTRGPDWYRQVSDVCEKAAEDIFPGTTKCSNTYTLSAFGDKFVIEAVLAGYKKDHISVKTNSDNSLLYISAKYDSSENKAMYNPGNKDFTIPISNLEVECVQFADGLLRVILQSVPAKDKNSSLKSHPIS